MPKPILRRFFLVPASLLLAACSGRGEGEGAAKMDTANARWEDGLSAEQVQSEAKALSPEEAARMGIAVDTSIHLEQLDARDTLPGGAADTAADSVVVPADSVP
jgi:nucleoid-associated protein YgaU